MDQPVSALLKSISQPRQNVDVQAKTKAFEIRSVRLKEVDLVLGWPVGKWEAYYATEKGQQIVRGIATATGWLDAWLGGKRRDCPGFLLYGKVGPGKTGGALLLALRAARAGCPTMYVTVDSAMRDMASTEWSAKDGETKAGFGDRFFGPAVLVLDDACARGYSPQERAFLLDLVRGRHDEGKITIITTNLPLDTDAGEDLWDSLLNGQTRSTFLGWKVNASNWGPSLRGRDDSNAGEV